MTALEHEPKHGMKNEKAVHTQGCVCLKQLSFECQNMFIGEEQMV